MNIHFKDIELFERLKSATIAKVRVGSHLYGTNNENSDEDFLYIYATSENELDSFIQTNHQLQYKENNIDHNFVSIHTFIKNIINGDSPINFEVVQSKELIGTDIEFLHDFKNSFITYTVIRSYLGLARRDVKYWNTAKTDYEKRKRLMHIVRGYLYANDMISNRFDFDDINKSIRSMYNSIQVEKFTLDVYSNHINELRTRLNNDKTIKLPKILNVKDGIEIYDKLKSYMKTSNFLEKQSYLKDFDYSIFINALENWVEY